MNGTAAGTKRPVRSLFIFASIIAAAALLASSLPLGYLPENSAPAVSVSVEWRGAFEEAVERDLTIPLENALADIPGLEEMFSFSERDRCRIYLNLSRETDLDEAYLDVREAVEGIRSRLPASSRRPVLAKSGFDDGPVFIAAFGRGAGRSEDELKRLYEGIEGSGEVESAGGVKREILLETDPFAADSSGLSLFTVLDAVRSSNVAGAFGKPGEPPRVFDHRLSAPRDFEGIPLGGGLVLGSLAAASSAPAPRDRLSLVDGEEKIIVYVRAAGNANAVRLSERLGKLTSSIPDSRVLYDYGALVTRALSTTFWALSAGAAMILLSSFFILRSIPAALLIALNIPFSFTLALAARKAAGAGLDLMGLAGLAAGSVLAAASGMLYAENFFRFGRVSAKAAASSVRQVTLTAAATASEFLPLLFASPRLSSSFGGIGVAMASALAASVLYVRFFLPSFMDGCCKAKKPFTGLSRRALPIPSPNRGIVLFVLLASGFGAFLLSSGIVWEEPGFEGKQSLRFVLEYSSGTTLERVALSSKGVGEALGAARGVKSVCTKFEKERATFDVEIEDENGRRTAERAAEDAALEAGDAFLHVKEPENRRSSFEVTLSGPLTGELRRTARDLAAAAGSAPGVRGIVYHFKETAPVKRLLIDPAAAALLGVEPRTAASLLRWSLSSPSADKALSRDEETDVRLGVEGAGSYRTRDMLDLPVPGRTGSVRLGEFSAADETEGMGRIHRLNRRRSESFTVLTETGKTKEAAAAVRMIIGGRTLPAGCTAETAGEAGRGKRDSGEALLLLLLSPVSLLLVLLFAFESPGVPFFILAQVPFVLVLPAGLFRIFGLSLSPAAAAGLVLAAGICVNDSLFLFERTTAAPFAPGRLAGAFRERFRALLAATFTAEAGILPLLFTGAAGAGDLVSLSLAIATGALWAPFVLAAFIALAGTRAERPQSKSTTSP